MLDSILKSIIVVLGLSFVFLIDLLIIIYLGINFTLILKKIGGFNINLLYSIIGISFIIIPPTEYFIFRYIKNYLKENEEFGGGNDM